MRRTSLLLIGVAALWMGGPALGAQPDHTVERGDTLWDLSGRYWNDPRTWPELWSLNAHFRNPHIIEIGDPVFLRRAEPEAPAAPEERVVRLPLERLVPPAPAPAEPAAQEAAAAVAAPEAGPPRVSLTRGKGLDFISPRRLGRLGTLDNRHQVKVVYAAGEDVEFAVAPGVDLRPGDRVTVVDDSEEVWHPLTGAPGGYYVSVLGQLEVLAVDGGRAVGWLAETYDAVEDGDAVIPYRAPVGQVAMLPARPDAQGLILRGAPGQVLFGTDDVVFLDRGVRDGLAPGATLEIPVREGRREAQGVVDLGTPLAQLLVVAVEEETATCLVTDSRAALEAGDRFVAAAVYP